MSEAVRASLAAAHRGVLEALVLAEAFARARALEGDPVARHVVEQLDSAWLALAAENVAGSAYLAEAGA